MTDALYTFKNIARGPYYYVADDISRSTLSTLFSGGVGELYHIIGIAVSPSYLSGGSNNAFSSIEITDGATVINLISGGETLQPAIINTDGAIGFLDSFVPIDYRNTDTLTVKAQGDGGTGSMRVFLIYTKLN